MGIFYTLIQNKEVIDTITMRDLIDDGYKIDLYPLWVKGI